MRKTTIALIGFCVALSCGASRTFGQESENRRGQLLFVQRNKVIAFQVQVSADGTAGTGQGAQVGTASGLFNGVGEINGISIVNFTFTTTQGSSTFSFDNRAGITDTDGDQVIFKNVGTGTFICTQAPSSRLPFSCTSALPDPTIPAMPGTPGPPPYQVFGNGIGAKQTGTYEVVAASGKFAHIFKVGQVFQYRAVSYNPSSPPADAQNDLKMPSPGVFDFTGSLLGSVYIEVFSQY